MDAPGSFVSFLHFSPPSILAEFGGANGFGDDLCTAVCLPDFVRLAISDKQFNQSARGLHRSTCLYAFRVFGSWRRRLQQDCSTLTVRWSGEMCLISRARASPIRRPLPAGSAYKTRSSPDAFSTMALIA